jgi:hypothetical protein
VKTEALPYVLPTPSGVVAERMAAPMERIVRELTATSGTAERESREPRYTNAVRPSPMRSMSSLAQRPMQPLWHSLPAIEAMLAPLNHKRYRKKP